MHNNVFYACCLYEATICDFSTCSYAPFVRFEWNSVNAMRHKLFCSFDIYRFKFFPIFVIRHYNGIVCLRSHIERFKYWVLFAFQFQTILKRATIMSMYNCTLYIVHWEKKINIFYSSKMCDVFLIEISIKWTFCSLRSQIYIYIYCHAKCCNNLCTRHSNAFREPLWLLQCVTEFQNCCSCSR